MKKQNGSKGYDRNRQIIKGIWRIVTPNQSTYIIGIILFSVHKFTENVLYGLVYGSVTSISRVSSLEIIFIRLTIIFLSLLLLSAIKYIGELLIKKTSLRTSTSLCSKMVQKLSRIPIQSWYAKHSSYWMNILSVDIDIVNNMLTERFVMISQNIISAIFGFIYVWLVDPLMAVFALVSGIFYLLAAKRFKSQTKDVQKRMRKKEDACSAVYEEAIHAYSEIKFYNRISNYFRKELKRTNTDYAKEGNKYAKLHTQSVTSKNFGYTVSYLGSLIWGLFLVKMDRITLEGMLAIWPVAVGIAYAIQSFAMQGIVIQRNLVSVERIIELLKQKDEVSGTISDVFIPNEKPVIEFCNVSFQYSDNTPVLKNISFSIKKGEKVVILGPSGSGKTTILKLLLKLYDACQGEIKIYGENIQNYDLDWLRQQFSYLPQEPKLINDTLSDNLRLVTPNASDMAIQNALKQAYVIGFGIDENGFEKELGESGKELSGGQRQRVGLARCYLREAPIYLMDEMTSALDTSLEKAISKEIMSNDERTVIIVTHKREISDLADHVININSQGQLALE